MGRGSITRASLSAPKRSDRGGDQMRARNCATAGTRHSRDSKHGIRNKAEIRNPNVAERRRRMGILARRSWARPATPASAARLTFCGIYDAYAGARFVPLMTDRNVHAALPVCDAGGKSNAPNVEAQCDTAMQPCDGSVTPLSFGSHTSRLLQSCYLHMCAPRAHLSGCG